MQSGLDEERKEQAEKREERGADDSERRSDASARLETLVSANAKVGLSNQEEGAKIVPSERGRRAVRPCELHGGRCPGSHRASWSVDHGWHGVPDHA